MASGVITILNGLTTSSSSVVIDEYGNVKVSGLGVGTDGASNKLIAANDFTISPATDKQLYVELSGANPNLQLINTDSAVAGNVLRQAWRLNSSVQTRTYAQIEVEANVVTDASRHSVVRVKTNDAGAFGNAIVISGHSVGVAMTPSYPLDVAGTCRAESLRVEGATDVDQVIQLVENGTAKFTLMNDASDDTFQLRQGASNGAKLIEVTPDDVIVTRIKYKEGGYSPRVFWSSAGNTKTVSNSNAETTLLPSGSGTLTVPSALLAAGTVIRATVCGTLSQITSDGFLYVRLNGGGLGFAIQGSPTDEGFQLVVDFSFSSSTAGQAAGLMYHSDAGDMKGGGSSIAITGISGDVTVDVTCQFSTASASNSVTLKSATLEVLEA